MTQKRRVLFKLVVCEHTLKDPRQTSTTRSTTWIHSNAPLQSIESHETHTRLSGVTWVRRVSTSWEMVEVGNPLVFTNVTS
jgi:hypothetical protein